MNTKIPEPLPQPTIPDPSDLPTVDDLVTAVIAAENKHTPRLCATCGMPPNALIHTGDHPARCHEFASPAPSWLVTCSTCGWSCTCSTYGLVLEEAETHERMDKQARIDFREVTR